MSGTDGTSILTFDPNGAFESLDTGEFAFDSFSYTASDTDTSSAPADVDVTITGVNDAPVCEDVEITTDEDTVGSTAPDCTDAESDTLTYSVTAAVTGVSGTDTTSTLTYDPNGQFEYLAEVDEASDAFTYTAFDGDASSVAANVDVTILGVNDAPVRRRRDHDRREHRGSTAPDGQRPPTRTTRLATTVTLRSTGPSDWTDTSMRTALTSTPAEPFEVLDTGEVATRQLHLHRLRRRPTATPATLDITIDRRQRRPGGHGRHRLDERGHRPPVAAPGVPDQRHDRRRPDGRRDQRLRGLCRQRDHLAAVAADPQRRRQLQLHADRPAQGSTPARPRTTSSPTPPRTAPPPHTATLTITVNGLNDAPVAEDDTAIHHRGRGGSTCSPTTPTSTEPLTYRAPPAPRLGPGTRSRPTHYTYTPNAASSSRLDDGEAKRRLHLHRLRRHRLRSATLNVTVNGVNDAPVANDDTRHDRGDAVCRQRHRCTNAATRLDVHR